MNSIVRIIIRGLISGEIKPEPHVFEYLRELSERQLKRHSRILRLVEPAGQAVPPPDQHVSGDHRSGGNDIDECRDNSGDGSYETYLSRRSWLTFMNASCGHWIRVAGYLVVLCLTFAAGVAEANAVVSERMEFYPSTVAAASPGSHSLVMAGTPQPIVHAALLASGILLVGSLVRAGWQWFCRNKLFVMTAYEVALQELETAEHRTRRGGGRDYHGQVLNILQRYVRAQLKLVRPGGMDRDTFLCALTERAAPLTGYQKLLLRDVINHAAEHALESPEQIEAVSQKASRFIWATACYRPTGSGDVPQLVGTTGGS